MTQNELARFLQAVDKDEKLRAALVEFARRHGYQLTAEELTDAQLDDVAGGKLSIGKSGDKYEQEADEAADKVIQQ
jgi:hypothetical protein